MENALKNFFLSFVFVGFFPNDCFATDAFEQAAVRYRAETQHFKAMVNQIDTNTLKVMHSNYYSSLQMGCKEGVFKYGVLGLAIIYDSILNGMSLIPGVDSGGWANRLVNRPLDTLKRDLEMTNLDGVSCAV